MTLASCYFRTVDGETRVGIFALRDIKIGEELTYDYKYVNPIPHISSLQSL
jgi:SET domain-containing protein